MSFFSIYKKLKFSGYYFLDFMIMFLFVFQGLLSFSRGGMIVGILAIIILLFQKIRNNLGQSIGIITIAGVLIYGTFMFADNVTGGLLTLRYQGETEGTLSGNKEKTTDVLTSGRVGILEGDIEIWLSSPIFGVGCGSSSYLRDSEYDIKVASHIEFSRLLAEHGLLGLVYFLVLLSFVRDTIRRIADTHTKAIIAALVFIAIATSFHAAMRTYVTPMLLLISAVKIRSSEIDAKNTIYRVG